MPVSVEKGFHSAVSCRKIILTILSLVLTLIPNSASAELAVSELIVEFNTPASTTRDLELFNDSPERMYLTVEPREIIKAGLPYQSDYKSPDPAVLGLLVSPRRLILEPGQRKALRITRLENDPKSERVYRITVKPVIGGVEGDTGLKLLVGYDLLVLSRPARAMPQLLVFKEKRNLKITNAGNASIELLQGRACSRNEGTCRELPPKRLYPGVTWEQTLPIDSDRGEYQAKIRDKTELIRF